MIFTAGTLNVFKRNGADEIFDDLEEAARHASVFGVQEAWTKRARRAVRRFKRRNRRWGSYTPRGRAREASIFWDGETWARLHGSGKARTHKGRRKVSPSRYVTWVPLLHRETGKRVLFLNTHAVNGYSHARNNREHLRDVFAHLHWTAVRAVAKKAISSGEYDAIVLVGDFNCRLENDDERFYPGPMLEDLFEFDPAHGIDRIVVHGADFERRWSRHVHSDHRLNLATLRV